MELPLICLTFLLAFGQIHMKQLAPGPQALKEATSTSTSSPTSAIQKNQKRYATKEIILYLTPSQIRALQAGNDFISPIEYVEQQQYQPLEVREQPSHDFLHQQFENINQAPFEEQQVEDFKVSTPFPNENQEHNIEFSKPRDQQYEYSNLKQNKQIDQVKIWKENERENQRNRWESFTSTATSETNEEHRALHEQLKRQWNRILDHNRIQLKTLSSLSEKQQNSEHTEKPLPQLQPVPRYNDQKNAIEIEKFIRQQRHRHELEKQSAVARVKAIANSPPILLHEEEKITKKHHPEVKHVEVPVSAPVLQRVSEPQGVRLPQPYSVPLEGYKPVPVPVEQTEIEEDKHLPYQVQQRIPERPLTKIVFNSDKFYFV